MKLFGLEITRAEKRGTPVDSLLTAGMTGNTKQVNEDTALALSAVWACVDLISATIAGLPRSIRQRTTQGSEKADQHPAHILLTQSPNEYQDALTWTRLAVLDMIYSNGNHYSLIERNGNGDPVALLPIHGLEPRMAENQIVYVLEQNDGPDLVFGKNEVFHVMGLSLNGYEGVSPLTAQKETIQLGLAAQQYGREFYEKDATPRGLLTYDGTLKPEVAKKVRASWNSLYGMGGKRTAVLDGGWKFNPLSIAPSDAQYLDTRTFQKNEIASIFRVPPHMIGEMGRATWNNVELMGIEFVTYCLMPIIRAFESEVDNKLIKPSERETTYCKWNANGLMRGDSAARAQFYRTMREIQVLSANDVRELEDLNKIEGGDLYANPLQNQTNNGEGN